MRRLFVHSSIFDRKWKQAGFPDELLRDLQNQIISYPESGAVVKGTHGLRKLRWNKPHQGKRGGIRVFYVDFPDAGVAFLLNVLDKNEREDLSKEDYSAINDLINTMKSELKRKSL
jgi:hypothetical protein